MSRAAETDPILLRPIETANLRIRGNIILAPMAGWSDAPFRSICLDWGAAMGFTEIVSSEALIRNNQKTLRLLARGPGEKQLGVQIFSSSPEAAAGSLAAINPINPDVVDLNCGCSIPKILKSGCGAALLRTPGKIEEIVRAMCAATHIPVSVKLRSGWDRDSINYLTAAEAAAEGGAAMVTLHPRTRSELFSGRAEWDHIRILKTHMSLPILGSGDLFTARDVRSMLEETACDGVMIGRGAMGNPFIFNQVAGLLRRGREPRPPSLALRQDTALRQLERAALLKGEAVACREMRKHMSAYTRGMPGSAVLRRDLTQAVSLQEYRAIIERYLCIRSSTSAA